MRNLQSLFLFFLLISTWGTSSAQENSVKAHAASQLGAQYVSVSFATLTTDYLLDGYNPGRPTEYHYANKGFAGAVSINYRYQLSRRFYIGLTEIVEQQNGNWLDNEIPGGNVFNLQTSVKGLFVRTCFTTAADFVYDYNMSDFCRLYMAGGLGATYELETDQYNPEFYNNGYWHGVNSYGAMRQHNNKVHANFYYSPLGIKAGRRLCYFLELGFGYKGVVNTGLSYKLK